MMGYSESADCRRQQVLDHFGGPRVAAGYKLQ